MRYGSVCSGIESASVAWEPLGFTPTWFAEVEPFPSAVLAHHWPHVANMGDMTQLPALIGAGVIEAPDILVGGTPCQAFSVAGMRKGLDDDRGQLTIKYVEVANAIDEKRLTGRECIAVWENVPGVLSSKDNAFGCFLAALVGENDPLEPAGKKWGNAGVVYGPQRVAAWRVLDAQYFGVAQRRRRVFVVASARDGFNPAAVLFEFEGLRRDTPPSRETGQETAGDAGGGAYFRYQNKKSGLVKDGIASTLLNQQTSTDERSTPGYVVHGTQDPCVSDKAFALGRNGGRENVLAVRTAQTSANGHGIAEEVSHTLDGTQGQAVCFAENSRAEVRLEGGDGKRTGVLSTGQGVPMVAAFSAGQSKGAGSIAYNEEQAPTLRGGASGTNQVPTLHEGTTVRRLTPRECERLQGAPDDHTRIPWRVWQECKKKGLSYESELIKRGMKLREPTTEECPDGPRYKAIGNSKAVPVVMWLGDRIKRHVKGEL